MLKYRNVQYLIHWVYQVTRLMSVNQSFETSSSEKNEGKNEVIPAVLMKNDV